MTTQTKITHFVTEQMRFSVINKYDWDKNKRERERNIDPDQMKMKRWDTGSDIIRERQQWPSLL